MGYPELAPTIDRRAGPRRSPALGPHQHVRVADSRGAMTGPDGTLVALALALQDGCTRCVEHHGAEAGRLGIPRLRLLEALATSLLLSTPQAHRWPRLAEAALDAHEHGTSTSHVLDRAVAP